MFVLLGVSSVKGGLAEIRWLKRPLVCRRSWREDEHALRSSAVQALSLREHAFGTVQESGEEFVLPTKDR